MKKKTQNYEVCLAKNSQFELFSKSVLNSEDSALLFGGLHEYIPPIYDEKVTKTSSQNCDTLFPSILNNNENEKAKEI